MSQVTSIHFSCSNALRRGEWIWKILMPCPCVNTPTTRSPGTAPPSSNVTGTSLRAPRMGIMAPGLSSTSAPLPVQRNFNPITLERLNQPSSDVLRPSRFGGRGIAGPLRSSMSGMAAFKTSAIGSSSRPTAANTSSKVFCVSLGSALRIFSSAKSWPARSKADTSRRRPSSEYCRRRASRTARRMAERALPVTARRSHAAGGVWPLATMMSTSSPFLSTVVSGNWRPLMLAPTQPIADVGMHGVGEIDRCRPPRQRDQPPLRREAEDLIVEQLELGVFEELLRAVAFEQRRQPAAAATCRACRCRCRRPRRAEPLASRVLVERMRGDAEFGGTVHVVACGSAIRRADAGGRRSSCGSTDSCSAWAWRCSP